MNAQDSDVMRAKLSAVGVMRWDDNNARFVDELLSALNDAGFAIIPGGMTLTINVTDDERPE